MFQGHDERLINVVMSTVWH